MTLPLRERDALRVLSALSEVSQAVSNASSLDQILQVASAQAARLLGADKALVLLADDGGGLRVRAQHGLDEPPAASFDAPLTETLMAQLANLLGEPLTVPLVARGNVTGVLAVSRAAAENADVGESILTALADQMGAAVESARLAEEVREAQLVAENAEQATGIGVFCWDVSRNAVTWSPEVYRLHGLPLEAPPSFQKMLATVHPDDRTLVETLIQTLRIESTNAQEPMDDFIEAEYRVILPDGRVRWLARRARFVPGSDRRSPRMLGVVFDITERKRVEAALSSSEERFRLTTEGLASFVYDWHAATNEVQFLGSMEQVLGFQPEAIPSNPEWWRARVHPDDLPQASSISDDALRNGAAGWSVDYRIQHRDGHYVDIVESSRIVRDASGGLIRIVGGVRDATRRVALERERQTLLDRTDAARADAEAAVRARDEMLGVVSHDLGNMLAAMAMSVEGLMRDATSLQSPDRVLQGLSVVERSTVTMLRLIHDLLDFASMEKGSVALDLRDEAPRHLLVQAAELFRRGADESGVTLTTRARSDLPRVRADQERILQALANLIRNALKYTPRGGHVSLRAKREQRMVCFTVQDTGVGISKEELPHVFDRYWTKKRASGRHGMGLGLAIVKGIVDAHGGTVSVRSAVGRGSRFNFSIPIAFSSDTEAEAGWSLRHH
jgi:PAS domain S-box-containing protein